MKENEHWLRATFSSLPRRGLKTQLKEQEEEKRVLSRKHKTELDDINWRIWLTKDHLSLPYKKLSGWKR